MAYHCTKCILYGFVFVQLAAMKNWYLKVRLLTCEEKHEHGNRKKLCGVVARPLPSRTPEYPKPWADGYLLSTSDQPVRATQRESQDQSRQNAGASLVSSGDLVGVDFWSVVLLPGVRASVGVTFTRATSLRRIRGLQALGLDHVGANRGQGAHLLSDAVGAIPCGLRPFHAAGVAVFAAAALSRSSGGGCSDVGPDLVGKGGDELSCDGQPANGVALECEAVGVAVANRFARLFNDNIVLGKELAEGAIEQTLERGHPFLVFGLQSGVG